MSQQIKNIHKSHPDTREWFGVCTTKKTTPYTKPLNAVFLPPDPNVLYYGELFELTGIAREGE